MPVFFIISGILAALLGTPVSLIVGSVLVGTGAVIHEVRRVKELLEP